MKTVKITYFQSPSNRPFWLLSFLGNVKGYFKEVDDDSVNDMLGRISNYLNEHSFTQRRMKRSCDLIRREIKDGKLTIYSSTGDKVIASIEFE